MDALALLCNLYGDGPSTLKRLRAHGLLRIEDLCARQAGDLATVLALTPAIARRFLKEASALEQRVLNSEDAVKPVEQAPAPKRAGREVVRGKQAMLAAAAQRWTELDRTSPVLHTQHVAQPEHVQEAPVVEGGTPLAAAELDRATFEALHGIGIRTLEDLAGMDSEIVAAAAGLGLSQVLFAQGLARREARAQIECAQRAAPADDSLELVVCILKPAARTDARFSPSERAPAQWLPEPSGLQCEHESVADEGAGPFA